MAELLSSILIRPWFQNVAGAMASVRVGESACPGINPGEEERNEVVGRSRGEPVVRQGEHLTHIGAGQGQRSKVGTSLPDKQGRSHAMSAGVGDEDRQALLAFHGLGTKSKQSPPTS
jgi:hypothetical protein